MLREWVGRLAAVIGVAVVTTTLLTPGLAEAAPATVRQRSAQTVTADALPTVQINGVVWTQVMIGNVVYAGGEFTTARPAGAAPGTQQVARKNLLAYDITTGKLITDLRPGRVQRRSEGLGGVGRQEDPVRRRRLHQGRLDGSLPLRGPERARRARWGRPRPSFNNTVNALAVSSTTVYAGVRSPP